MNDNCFVSLLGRAFRVNFHSLVFLMGGFLDFVEIGMVAWWVVRLGKIATWFVFWVLITFWFLLLVLITFWLPLDLFFDLEIWASYGWLRSLDRFFAFMSLECRISVGHFLRFSFFWTVIFRVWSTEFLFLFYVGTGSVLSLIHVSNYHFIRRKRK